MRRTARPLGRIWRLRRFHQGLLLGIIVAVCIDLLIAAQFFTQAQLSFTNFLYASSPVSDEVVIVAIDDYSLGAYGRSVVEWPRRLHAELLDQLAKAGARAVAFDVLFVEPTADDARFAESIRNARQSDSRTRTILAFVGRGEPATENDVLNYPEALFPVEPLRSAAEMLGHVNTLPDPDRVIRQMPLVIHAQQATWLSLSAAAYLQYLRVPGASVNQVVKVDKDQVTLTTQRKMPVSENAEALINFFGPAGTFRTYSYKQVHDGEFDPSAFKDKVVLVGFKNGAGVTDAYSVPISQRGEPMSGIEIHANIMEMLIRNRPLVRASAAAEWGIMALLAILSAVSFTQLRRFWPIVAYWVILALVFAAASVLMTAQGIILSFFFPLITVTIALVGALTINIRIEFLQRRQVQSLLRSATRLIEQRLFLEELLPAVAEEIARLLETPNNKIWLWNEDENRFDSVYSTSGLHPPSARNALVAESLSQREMLQQGQVAAIPLTFQARPLGVIESVGRISDEVLALAWRYADQVGPAIAHARLYTNQTQQKKLLEVILKRIPNPLVVLDNQQQVIRANASAQALFKLTESEGLLTLLDVFKTLEIAEDSLSDIRQELVHAEPFQLDFAAGKQVFTLGASPLQDSGWVIVLNDITSLKDLDAFKTQMIRMASHDIKNPMGVIIGYTELLLDDPMNDEQRRLIKIIQDTAKHTLDLTSDLLNVERIRGAHLDMQIFDLGALADEVMLDYRNQANDKQQKLTIQLPAEPVMVKADRSQLQQAISNLIGNALKYTLDGGSITVRVSRERTRARFAVQDTGVGIPPQAMDRLFQPFYRIKTKATAKIAGTGLGLHLAKTVVENHRGRIWADSEDQKGSTFTFELPLSTP